MTIREYKDSDKEAVIKFMENQQDELSPLDPFKRERKEGYGKNSLNNLLKDSEDKGKILVAEIDGKVIGYISGNVKHIDEFDYQTGGQVDNGMLDNVYVLPEHRKNGVAKALVNELEKFFKDNNCEIIWLNVFSQNEKAVNLYLNLGYSADTTVMIKKLII